MIEKRLIDANALHQEVIFAEFDTIFDGIFFAEIILKAPTVDAVEVVRGKDCKHWNQAKMISPLQGVCEKFTNAPYIYNYRSRNDFCSHGENRE